MPRVLMAVVILGWLLAGPASAAYVFYYEVVGEWTIVCWRDQFSDQRLCHLTAPRDTLSYEFPPNVIMVEEYAPDAFQVAVRIRHDHVPGIPVSLKVDGNRTHETAVDGEFGRWTGDDARAILSEMQKGDQVIYRVQTPPDGLPIDTRVGLLGFRQALATYRGLVRVHGLIPDG